MPTASRLGRRHRSDAVSRTARRDRRARNYADGQDMSTAAVGVSLGKPTAVLGRRGPSAYVWIARRLYYADGLDMAVGIALTRPTVAVGIDMAVGIGPCSGSDRPRSILLPTAPPPAWLEVASARTPAPPHASRRRWRLTLTALARNSPGSLIPGLMEPPAPQDVVLRPSIRSADTASNYTRSASDDENADAAGAAGLFLRTNFWFGSIRFDPDGAGSWKESVIVPNQPLK